MTLFRLSSFRAALTFTLIVVVLVGLVLGLVLTRLGVQLREMQDRQVWREIASLSQIYEQDGARGLALAVSALSDTDPGMVLRFSSQLGAFLGGNLQYMPLPRITEQKPGGWIEFPVQNRNMRARFAKLDNDVVLLIGYDLQDRDELLADMRAVMLAALIGLSLLGVFGGRILADRARRQVAAVNAELQPVMAGALNRRVTVSGSDEWAEMADHINAMLDRLEQMMAATKQVSDNLAHDLRSPLTRLHIRLQRLAEQAEPALAGEIEEALAETDGLLRSFAALLTLSRLDSGVTKLVRKPVDITALVSDLHDLFEAVFADAEMDLPLKADTVQGFFGDAALLQQALSNLLENVLTHAKRRGSKVRMAVHDKGAMVELSIADGGAGIAPQDRARAQERFVRLDASRSGEGSGLGLSLAAAIASHHGGRLSLADNKPGLVVTLTLPKRAS
ncbi:MAG: sensor histidine kinase [Parvibaculales bacterium]